MYANENDKAAVFSSAELIQCSDPENLFPFNKPNLRSSRDMDNFARPSKYFLFYEGTRKLINVSKAVFIRVGGPVFNVDGVLYKTPSSYKLGRKKFLQLLNTPSFQPQTGVGDFFSGISVFYDALSQLGEVTERVGSWRELLSMFTELLADVYMLSQLNVTKLGDITVAMYKMYRWVHRFKDVTIEKEEPIPSSSYFSAFFAQSFDALSLSMLSLAMPPALYEIIKRMSTFTSRRLLDDMNWIFELVGTLIEYFLALLSFLQIPQFILDKIKDVLDYLPFAPKAMYIHNMRETVNSYQSNGSLMNLDSFRAKVKTLHSKISKDLEFMESMNRSNTLKDNFQKFSMLYKSCLAYEEATRVEPCLFVFEGPPGTLKSVRLQQLVSAMKTQGKTVFSHTFKPKEDTKDWYDTYNGETILQADDVGQQSLSQWRHMINMISPIKYPLDCATAHLKHTKYFCSEYVMVTTNKFMTIENVSSQDCIGDLQALFRRGYVFDFQVKRVEGEHEGPVHFTYYDMSTSDPKWVRGFPPGCGLTCPSTFQTTLTNKILFLRWLNHIITRLNEWKREQNSCNSLSQEDLIEISTPLESQADFQSDEAPSRTYLNILKYFSTEYVQYFLERIYLLLRESLQGLDNVKTWVLRNKYLLLGTILAFSASYFVWKWLDVDPCAYNVKTDILKSQVEPRVETQGPTAVDSLTKCMYEVRLDYSTPLSMKEKEVLGWDTSKTFYDESTVFTIGLFSGHYLIIPGHAIPVDTTQLTIFRSRPDNNCLLENVTCNVAFRSPKDDICVLALPRTMVALGKSCAKHFIPTKNSSVSNNLWYITPRGYFQLRNTSIGSRLYNSAVYRVFDKFTDFAYDVNLSGTKDLFYENLSGVGLCGNLIYNTTNGLIGMHIAGEQTTKLGAAKIWSYSTVQQLKKLLSADTSFFVDVNVKAQTPQNVSGAKLDLKGNARTQKQSSLIPTPAHGILGGTKTPANLSIYGSHTVKDLAKPGFYNTKSIPEGDLDFAAKTLECIMVDFDKISEHDTIKGFGNIAGINKDSSSGFNFPLEKAAYVDFEKGELKPSFRDEVESLRSRLAQGSLSWEDIVSVENLKDENRPPEKEGVPRTFQVLRFPLIFLQKQYLAKLADHIIDHRHFNGIVIGMNPFKEWKKLYSRLRECKCFDGDIKKFERTIVASLQQRVNAVVLKHYVGEDKMVLEAILSSLIWCFVMMNDDVWFKNHNMQSGCWVTALFNSFYRLCYAAMWYKNYSLDPHPQKFFTDIYNYVLGDDGLTGVKNLPNNIHLNNLTMAEYFAGIGIGYTGSDKKPITAAFTPLEDISFLKRGFSYHKEVDAIVCPLAMDTIKSMPDYYDKTKDLGVVLDGKINCLQREIFLHCDKREYTAFMDDFENQMDLRDIPFTRLPYSYLVSLYVDDIDEFSKPMIEAKFGETKFNK